MIWTTAALGATLTLSPEESLQDVVETASDGDTILVDVAYEPFEPFVSWSDKDLTIEGDGGVADIPPLAVDDASLVLRQIRIQESSSAYPVSVTLASDKGPEQLVLEDSTFEGNDLPVVAWAFSPSELKVEISDSTFSENQGQGALYVQYVDLVIDGTTFTDNETTEDGGAIRGSIVNSGQIRWSTFDRNTAAGDGGAISVVNGNGAPFVIENTTFSGNAGGSEGGDLTVHDHELALRYIQALDGQANAGGFLHMKDVESVNLDDVLVHRPKATTSGGAIYAWNAESLRITRSLFCAAENASTEYHAAMMHLDGNTTAELSMSNTVVMGTTGGANSPAIKANDASLEFIHTTFAENRTAYGVVLGNALDTLNIENTLVSDATSFVNYGQIDGAVLGSHNLWHGISSIEIEPRDDVTSLTDDENSLFGTDPQFVSDFDATNCATLPRLQPSSPAVDAGKGNDPDGGVADIGAFGGENSADLFELPSEPEDTGQEPPDSPVDSDSGDVGHSVDSPNESGVIESGTDSVLDTAIPEDPAVVWVTGGCRGPLGAGLIVVGALLVRRQRWFGSP